MPCTRCNGTGVKIRSMTGSMSRVNCVLASGCGRYDARHAAGWWKSGPGAWMPMH